MNYTIQARITPQVFQEFAWFDMLRQQRRCRAPALFAAIMALFASVCFLMSGRVKGALMLGSVLLGVGLILPLGWLLSFQLSLRKESKRLKLAQSPIAYTLRFTDQGLIVSRNSDQAEFPWSGLRACRLRHCISLYTAPRQAFLLPMENISDMDTLWGELCSKLPPEGAHDFRRR